MLKTRIKRFGTLLMLILLLSMAADGGLATGGSDASSSKSTEDQTLNLGKSFAHCKRLVKNNTSGTKVSFIEENGNHDE